MVPLIAAVLLVCAGDAQTPFVQVKDIPYSRTQRPDLCLDVFMPPGKGSDRCGIVDIVSNSWRSSREKVEQRVELGMYQEFCSRGFVIFAVQPGSVDQFTGDEMAAHVQRAIRWAKAHAAEYGADPDRIGLMGGSAGGNLACVAFVTPCPGNENAADPVDRFSTQVKAAAFFFPATNLLDWDGGEFPWDKAPTLLFADGCKGHSAHDREAAARRLSPALNAVPGLPPSIFYHGDADPLVPLQQSQVMVKALQAAGNEAELIVKPGGGHPWPDVRVECASLAEWFAEHMTCEAPPAAPEEAQPGEASANP